MKPAQTSFLPASLKLIHVCLLLLATVCFAADPKGKFTLTKNPALGEMGYPTNLTAALTLGQSDVRRDLTNGIFKLKSGGLPGPDAFTFDRLLEARCKYQTDWVCGCVASSSTFEYIKGYNSVAVARLEEKFGTNIFNELERQAEIEESKPPAYEVKSGDTLLKIARQNGITLKALLAANPKVNYPKILAGQKLVIPAAEPSKQK